MSTTTTRGPALGTATGGAVRQDGTLYVAICKRCEEAGYPGQRIVWATSNRTGKKYPVNVTRGYHDQQFYMKHNAHKCEDVAVRFAGYVKAEEEQADRMARLADLQEAAKAERAAAEAAGVPFVLSPELHDRIANFV